MQRVASGVLNAGVRLRCGSTKSIGLKVCNLGLGVFEDEVRMSKYRRYLERHKEEIK